MNAIVEASAGSPLFPKKHSQYHAYGSRGSKEDSKKREEKWLVLVNNDIAADVNSVGTWPGATKNINGSDFHL